MWCEDKGYPSGSGSIGSIPQSLNDNLRTIKVGIPAELIQRCSLSGFARILKKALEMQRRRQDNNNSNNFTYNNNTHMRPQYFRSVD